MTTLSKIRLCLALACLAVYGGTLTFKEFVRDDQWLIERNPLLQGPATLPALLTTGYVEAVEGSSTPIQEYRPLLSLTFFLHVVTSGLSKPPMHAVNLLLHLGVCLLLLEALRRKMSLAGAAAGSLLFAVLPVHAEAVSYITSRSELLTALFLLAAWLQLDGHSPRTATASGLFFCALLTKEQAVLFPAFLALSDWTFLGAKPWEKRRRKIYAALLACLAVYLALRLAFLSRVLHAGVPYFDAPAPVAALTVARFIVKHYLLTSLTGVGGCADFSRPLIPDSSPYSMISWFCLAGITAFLALALKGLIQRRPWAFWTLGPLIFLAPTIHLIIPIDTLGAHRLLYFPSIALAWLFARFYERVPARIGAPMLVLLGLWYALRLIDANKAWSSELSFYQTAIACNPVSAKLKSSLGAYWISHGEPAAGMKELNAALVLDPNSSHAYYNLSRAAFERRDFNRGEELARRSLELSPSADAWVLLALMIEQRGRRQEAEECLKKALVMLPWHPVAHYNSGRLAMMRQDLHAALLHFSRFLELSPRDRDAEGVRQLTEHLRQAQIRRTETRTGADRRN